MTEKRPTLLVRIRARAIARRGATHRATGRNDQARADFDRAIELDPDQAGAIARRGETYLAMGRYDQALTDYSICAPAALANALPAGGLPRSPTSRSKLARRVVAEQATGIVMAHSGCSADPGPEPSDWRCAAGPR